jgi:hypothetical protein
MPLVGESVTATALVQRGFEGRAGAEIFARLRPRFGKARSGAIAAPLVSRPVSSVEMASPLARHHLITAARADSRKKPRSMQRLSRFGIVTIARRKFEDCQGVLETRPTYPRYPRLIHKNVGA